MQLTVIRHADAVAATDGMKDFERPLSPKGREEARAAARRFLAGQSSKPDLLLASPAVRTMQTAAIFAAELGYDPAHIQTDRRLYPGSSEAIEEIVDELDTTNIRHAAVFGHNPGISEYVLRLDGPAHTEFLPTAGFVTALI